MTRKPLGNIYRSNVTISGICGANLLVHQEFIQLTEQEAPFLIFTFAKTRYCACGLVIKELFQVLSEKMQNSVGGMNSNQWLYAFLLIWFLLNLGQSVFTELFNDEALYWAFSERLSWGYFDHPPLTAWLIASTSWIPGELGVRLPFILMGLGMIYMLWKLIEPKDVVLMLALLVGVPVMHVGGFFAAPDVPLLFFMTLFLYRYKIYFYRDNWLDAALMGACLGLMGLAKYHAILFAVALVLSNFQLLKRRSFYLTILMGLIIVSPHLYWQFQNDWVSFNFHLFSRRGEKPWSWNFVGDYLGGQLLIFGIFLAVMMWIGSIKRQPKDHYDCVYKYLFLTVFLFFTASVFKGRVEANWTAMAYVPMLYLTYFYSLDKPKWRKWLIGFAAFSLLIVLFVRLVLAFEIVPPENNPRNETHGFESWSEIIEAKAGDRPVVFINNYRKPAKYKFYTGRPTTSWNMSEYSGNQYDLWWQDETDMQGKNVLVISNELDSEDTMNFDHGIQTERIREVEDWASYNFLEVSAMAPSEGRTGGTFNDLEIVVYNPTGYTPKKSFRPIQIRAMWYQYEELKHASVLQPNLKVDMLKPGARIGLTSSLKFPEAPGAYVLKIGIMNPSIGLVGLNSGPYFVEVE